MSDRDAIERWRERKRKRLLEKIRRDIMNFDVTDANGDVHNKQGLFTGENVNRAKSSKRGKKRRYPRLKAAEYFKVSQEIKNNRRKYPETNVVYTAIITDIFPREPIETRMKKEVPCLYVFYIDDDGEVCVTMKQRCKKDE